MQEDFIIEQAKRFAKIVYRGASKFENLNELNARLNQELSPYDAKNKTIFISVWKDELVRLFHDHLQKCSNNDCPKNKTSKNAGFIVDQYNLAEKKNDQPTLQNTMEFIDQNDLNYYFNAKNIPNQDLVFETYNYFLKGRGKSHFQPLEFLNLLNWHYRFVNETIEKPLSVLHHFQNLPYQKEKKQILIGFVLKWFGGYPVNNLNSQVKSTLKFLESSYIEEIEQTQQQLQNLININLSGTTRSKEQDEEKIKLEYYLGFLNQLDDFITNREKTKPIQQTENQNNNSLNIAQNENKKQKEVGLLLFISHSSKDEEIVKLFTDKIIQLALQINLNNIFCTSIQAASITSGEDFRRVIKYKLQESSHVIQIITTNYKGSEVCLNEMGAAWVLNNKVIPFILPPINYNSVGFIHQPHQLLKLNEENDLLKFIDEMKPTYQNLKHSEIKRHVDDFIQRLKEILQK